MNIRNDEKRSISVFPCGVSSSFFPLSFASQLEAFHSSGQFPPQPFFMFLLNLYIEILLALDYAYILDYEPCLKRKHAHTPSHFFANKFLSSLQNQIYLDLAGNLKRALVQDIIYDLLFRVWLCCK